MRMLNCLPLAIAILGLYGCGSTATIEPQPNGKRSLENSDSVNAVETTVDDANILRRGQIVFLRCRSCHTLEENGPHLTGPNLHDLFGATAGTKEGYAFSEALLASRIVWTAKTLDTWVEQPNVLVDGHRMVFAGLPEAADRAALLAYLTKETKGR